MNFLRFCMKTTATEMVYNRDVKLIGVKWECPAVRLQQLKLVLKFRNYAIWPIDHLRYPKTIMIDVYTDGRRILFIK